MKNDNENKITYKRKRISLPQKERHDTKKWQLGVDEDDLHVSLNGIKVDNDPQYSITKVHDPLTNLKNYVLHRKMIYLHPPNDRWNARDT